MHIPITQSREWQKLQDDLGKISFLEKGPGFQYLAILESTPVGKYLYLPYGPVSAHPKGLEAAFKSLEALAREQRAFFIRIEPQDADFPRNFPNPPKKNFAKTLPKDLPEPLPKNLPKDAQKTPQKTLPKTLSKTLRKTTDLNPKETWLLDLTGNDDAFESRLPSRLRRYHRTAPKKGLTLTISHDPSDIHYLLELQKALASQKGINTFSEAYLKTELSQPFATLYLCRQGDELLAAGMVFDDGDTRYNLQGAQTEAGRKLHATGILTIQLILDARAKGLKTFDFWGIAPEGAAPDHPWAGFTAFKKSFAGREQVYAGTYDLVLRPTRYQLYRIFRHLNRLLRKI